MTAKITMNNADMRDVFKGSFQKEYFYCRAPESGTSLMQNMKSLHRTHFKNFVAAKVATLLATQACCVE